MNSPNFLDVQSRLPQRLMEFLCPKTIEKGEGRYFDLDSLLSEDVRAHHEDFFGNRWIKFEHVVYAIGQELYHIASKIQSLRVNKNGKIASQHLDENGTIVYEFRPDIRVATTGVTRRDRALVESFICGRYIHTLEHFIENYGPYRFRDGRFPYFPGKTPSGYEAWVNHMANLAMTNEMARGAALRQSREINHVIIAGLGWRAYGEDMEDPVNKRKARLAAYESGLLQCTSKETFLQLSPEKQLEFLKQIYTIAGPDIAQPSTRSQRPVRKRRQERRKKAKVAERLEQRYVAAGKKRTYEELSDEEESEERPARFRIQQRPILQLDELPDNWPEDDGENVEDDNKSEYEEVFGDNEDKETDGGVRLNHADLRKALPSIEASLPALDAPDSTKQESLSNILFSLPIRKKARLN